MSASVEAGEAGPKFENARYRLAVDVARGYVALGAPGGAEWAELSLLFACDSLEGRDETAGIEHVEVTTDRWPTIVVTRRSTRWRSATLRIACTPEAVELSASVEGTGLLGEVHLLGGRSVAAGSAHGFFPSGSRFSRLFSPNPEDPDRLVRSAREPAVIGVCGDARPGRGHWFFTPAPLFFALTTDVVEDPGAPAPDGWVAIGLAAPVAALDLTELAYLPSDGGFSLRLDFEGHRAVDGEYRAPTVIVSPGHAGPYEALRAHRDALVERGDAPSGRRAPRASWWSAPMFCGWGAQCNLARVAGSSAVDACTQANYDRFLGELGEKGLVPPTVVVDDGWQERYGRWEPSTARWPDLAGFVRRRHDQGQRVLLWWKAWEVDGVPDELCFHNAAGDPVAIDPTLDAARRFLEDNVGSMLSGDGLDADGLKIDFTARTPSGASLAAGRRPWGVALLHELLATIYRAAKAAKADALVITHAPHPSFADVSDMIRLNDMMRLDDPDPGSAAVVSQMLHRAAIVRAACPELLVDTDDWCAPDLARWRDYLAVKRDIGVPALYYTTHLDLTGEALEDRDYDALRTMWDRYQSELPGLKEAR